MPRLTTGQKAQRVVRFLIGLGRPRIASALALYGFNQTELDEGWHLLRALAGKKLAVQQLPAKLSPTLVNQLDAWENEWFVVAEASLRRHYPDIADKVFLNLSRTAGPEVVVSVGTFLSRVVALQGGSEQEQAAHALLAQRGLTADKLGQAQALLDEIGAVKVLPEPATDKEKIAAAESAMWAWYREWSSIARIVIKDGRQLRSLGFGPRRRNATTSEEVIDEPGDDAGAEQPAPSVPMLQPA